VSDGAPVHDFASDNHAGAHPEVLEAVVAANAGHTGSYGADGWTERAADAFRKHFGPDARAFAVFNGSAANVLSVDAVTKPHEAVICTETAHLHVDEAGAPERFAGVKLLLVETQHGKLEPADLDRWESGRGDQHRVQPRVVSIAQATELGTVYTVAELEAIAAAARQRGMYLHVDGARLANAAASLDLGFGDLTTQVGVDVVSFGGTKNGLLLGDAVVFPRGELAEGFEFVRKQGMQLASKMRFISAQFEALLEGDLWLRSAAHANAMASRLAAATSGIEGVSIEHQVEANAVFAHLPQAAIDRLLDELPGQPPFYVWDEAGAIVRWMCSWDTSEEDVDRFAAAVAEAVGVRE